MAAAHGAAAGVPGLPDPAGGDSSDEGSSELGPDSDAGDGPSDQDEAESVPLRRNPCDYNMPINPGADTPLALVAGLTATQRKDLVACRFNCGAVIQKNSGVVYDRRTGDIHDDAMGCSKQQVIDRPAPPAKRARLASHGPKAAKASDAPSDSIRKEAKRLGVQPAQIPHLPWNLDVKVWRTFLGLILAPSIEDRRAAATAVETLRPFLGRAAAAAAIETGAAVGNIPSAPVTRFHDQLRLAMPFARGDIVPRAAAIAAFLAIVDFNNAARRTHADKTSVHRSPIITVPPSSIRRGAVGDPIPAEDVVGLGLLKSMLDEGKAWFRDFVDRLAADRAGDSVHHIEASSTGKPGDSRIVAWPYQWAHLRVIGYKRHVDALPIDSPPPGLLTTLGQSGDLTESLGAEDFDLTPFLTQAGTLRTACAADVHAAAPRLSLRALARHAGYVALKYFDDDIDTAANASLYKAAIAAGAKVSGLPRSSASDAKSAADQGGAGVGAKRGRREKRSAAKQAASAAAAASAAGASARTAAATSAAAAAAATHHRPSGAIPLPPHPAAAAGAAAGSFTAGFKRCMQCGSAPPSGTSKGPFCRTCYVSYAYDSTTGRVTKKP